MSRRLFTCKPNFARCLIAGLSALPVTTFAQTLGDEVILSSLGDPIEVEIAVDDWEGFDISQLTVGNGNAEQYELFGLEYQPILDDLSFSIVGPNLAGEVKVLISSRQPVSEPFLELLLVLNWSAGSTLRDYVLLFDPPSLTQPPATSNQELPQQQSPQQQVAVTTPPTSPPEPTSTSQPDVRTQVAIAVDDVAGTATDAVPSTDALDVERRRYSVRNNDTLWVIARQFQPAGATENLYQFLVSLHDLNREAFINGNISLLRSGAELMIPTARDVSSINPATAQTLFEGRWADGTRVATGTASAPPPEFARLNEPVEEQAPEPAEPQRPPGSELPLAPENSGLLTTGTTEVAVVVEERSPPLTESPEALEGVPQVEATVIGGLASPLAPSDNPYLQQVVDSAQRIQQLLESRQQRLVQVEEQLLAMRVQMQEAQIAALELNAKLRDATAAREQQKAANLRNTAFLGTLVAGLMLALVVALRKVVQLYGQIGALNRARQSARQSVSMVAEPTTRFVAQGEVEVVEMEPALITDAPAQTGGTDEIDRDMDKIPPIDAGSPDVVDFLVVEPASPVEEPAEAPKSTV